MKKCLLFLFVCTLAFLSCETNEIETEESNIDLTKIENVKSLKGEEQKIAFRLLNNDSKSFLWEKKMENILLNDNLNRNQIEMIITLKRYISKDIYDRNHKNYDDNIYYISEWSSLAQAHFSKLEFVDYFGTISGKLPFQDGGSSPSCDCSFSSNHCGAYWEDIDCNEGQDDCEDTSWFGCGTLLSYWTS
ncbi:bacteriocin fulvocin C-related protein [Lacinutrix sp.]|uniref:bacteriocin fulvocin C-related protein n=1 Tax=Lacinutrix sp. TaxID=1937692 RepID=UPI0025C25661|nr:bacteriocin fulvocin C-related protein [Lacinutrix sp.]